MARPEIDIEKGRQFWAFQPPRRHSPPSVRNEAWPRTEVDRFILARLEGRGLQPVADAVNAIAPVSQHPNEMPTDEAIGAGNPHAHACAL